MSRFRLSVIGLGLLCLLGSSLIWRTGAQPVVSEENEFEFVGQVTNLPNTPSLVGDWVVGNRTVHVSPSTRIDGEEGAPVIGAIVQVDGTLRSDGSVDAS